MVRNYDEAYLNEIGKMRASRKNKIMYMVSAKVPKEEAGLVSDIENDYFDTLTFEAKQVEQKTGKWPVIEMEEIESDDPVLDIYRD